MKHFYLNVVIKPENTLPRQIICWNLEIYS